VAVVAMAAQVGLDAAIALGKRCGVSREHWSEGALSSQRKVVSRTVGA